MYSTVSGLDIKQGILADTTNIWPLLEPIKGAFKILQNTAKYGNMIDSVGNPRTNISARPIEVEITAPEWIADDLNISERTNRKMVESIWSDNNKIVPKIQSDGDETSLKQTTKIHSMKKKRRKNIRMMIMKRRKINPLMMNDYLF
ncbi:hypothetical protein DPMN_011477 [Dreissena polymorpha]|uniref:Uncharacterized protein n=1 Tax=Dreissena polymorpha TaxID=45954 RepID=A0A9D4S1W2_DREPO|nr:hypothetical protein DPMN_011477 [Dreissena polymorpha]